MKITLNIKKTIDQNAQVYFEKAKKSRKKLKGAQEALTRSLQKLEEEKKTGEQEMQHMDEQEQEEKTKQERKTKKEWYENFRWFISSEGFLVIGGRDATTNEIIIKKRAEKDDIVFHTDMAGSPFFVIKSEKGKEIGSETIQEVADATLCYSRAWKLGLGNSETFWVRPEQITKETSSGEYITKGAFMIKGKTNYVRSKMSFAVGITKDDEEDAKVIGGKIMGGPLSAVKKYCEKYVEVVQGNEKVSDIAKKIKHKIGGEIDEIIKALPSGGVQLKK